MAITPAFQAGDAGSIPAARSKTRGGKVGGTQDETQDDGPLKVDARGAKYR